ncbi:hypothetical protein ISCGN_032889 [Ixodes scapularis]
MIISQPVEDPVRKGVGKDVQDFYMLICVVLSLFVFEGRGRPLSLLLFVDLRANPDLLPPPGNRDPRCAVTQHVVPRGNLRRAKAYLYGTQDSICRASIARLHPQVVTSNGSDAGSEGSDRSRNASESFKVSEDATLATIGPTSTKKPRQAS